MTVRISPVSSISATSDALYAHRFVDVRRSKPQAAQWEVVEEVSAAPQPVIDSSKVDLLLNQWRVERFEQAREEFLKSS